MMMFAGFTKDQVDAELKWAAVHGSEFQFVGSFEEVAAYCDAEDGVDNIELADMADQTADMVRFVEAWERINRKLGRVSYADLFRAYSIEDVAAM